MSLLNRPSDGIHSVLIVIFKLLLSEKSLSREKIIGLCAPEGSAGEGQTRNTLNRWLELGLFQERKDLISLHADIVDSDQSIRRLPSVARRIILRHENNADLWATTQAKSADFTRSLCWLLAQDIWQSEFKGWSQAQGDLQSQLSDSVNLMQNDTRWPALKAWARYLGFGWSPRHAGGGITPDPSDAIRDVLADVFGGVKALSAADFVDLLSRELPVIDRGKYRVAVEEKLASRDDPDAWQRLPSGHLSTSLSRALLRLEEEQLIKCELLDDSPPEQRVMLTGRDRQQLGKDISQVTYLG